MIVLVSIVFFFFFFVLNKIMVHFKIDGFLDLLKYWSLYCVSGNSYLWSLCAANFGIFFFPLWVLSWRFVYLYIFWWWTLSSYFLELFCVNTWMPGWHNLHLLHLLEGQCKNKENFKFQLKVFCFFPRMQWYELKLQNLLLASLRL